MGDSYGADMADPHCFRRASPRQWSRVRTAVAACMLAVLATACIDAEMDFVVREDGSGSITIRMRIDTAVLELAALGEGSTVEELCQSAIEELGPSDPFGFGLGMIESSTEAVIEGSECVVTNVGAWDAADSESVLADMSDEDGFGLQRLESGGWRFELETASLSEDVTDDELFDATALGFDLPTLTLSVTLPGDAVEHNADAVRQSKYSWAIDLFAADEVPPSVYVETAPSSGLGPEAIGAIVAGVLLVLAALVTLHRHQEAKAAESSADDAESTTADANDSTASEPSDGDEARPAEM